MLTPEGETLQVCNSPRPVDEMPAEYWCMCHFDGKLLLGDYYRGEVVALQGL